MNPIRHSSLWLIPSLILFGCESNQVQIRFQTTDTGAQRFQLDSQMKLILQGDSNSPEAVGSKLRVTLHSTPIVAYDDGSARYQIEADSVAYRSDQRSVEECLHIERSMAMQEFQFKMASNGNMQDLRMNEFVPELEQTDLDLRRLLMKIQPELPGNPVSVGDTWERQHLLSSDSGSQAFVYKWFQVEDVFMHNHKKMAKLRMNIKYRLNDTTLVNANDFILGSGDVLFNITDGQIEDASLEITGSVNAIAPSMRPNLAPMQVRQTIRLRRLV